MPECASKYSRGARSELGDGIDPRVVAFRKFERLFGKVKTDTMLFLQLGTNHEQFEWWQKKASLRSNRNFTADLIEQAAVLKSHLVAAEVALKTLKDDPVKKLTSDTFGLQEMQTLETEVRSCLSSCRFRLTSHS